MSASEFLPIWMNHQTKNPTPRASVIALLKLAGKEQALTK